MEHAFDDYNPLALDRYGRRECLIPSIFVLGLLEDDVPELRFVVDIVYCTDCDRLRIGGREHEVITHLLTKTRAQGVNRSVYQVGVQDGDGVRSNVFIVPSGTAMTGWECKSMGEYHWVGSRVEMLSRPSINRVNVPDEKTMALVFGKKNSVFLGWLYNARLSWHRSYVRSLFRVTPGVGYVDEESYSRLVVNRRQFLKDPMSDTILRMVESAVVKDSTVRGKLQIDENTARSTGLVFCYLAGTRPVSGRECELIEVPREWVPLKRDYSHLVDVYVTNPEIVFSEDTTVFPLGEDNGLVPPTSSKDGGIYYQPNEGLVFKEAFSQPLVLRLIGPAQLSNSAVYDVKSTLSTSMAFQRFTICRENEFSYRACQDAVLSTLFGPVDRRLAVNFGFLQRWGISHNQLRRHNTLETKLTRRILRSWLAIRQSTMMTAVEADGEYFGQKFLSQHENRKEYAEEDHPKKKLRLMCIAKMESNPLAFYNENKTPVTANVKNETGKNGKRPRLFLSMGDPRVLEEPKIPRILKHAMERASHYRVVPKQYRDMVAGVAISDFDVVPMEGANPATDQQHWAGQQNVVSSFLATSTQNSMDKFFKDVHDIHTFSDWDRDEDWSKLTKVTFHSDDSNVTTYLQVLLPQGPVDCAVSFDMDIAKCDLSHGPGVFYTLTKMSESLGISTETLVNQLKTPVMIAHPDKTIEDPLIIKLNHLVLMSGSVLTTVVNSWACDILTASVVQQISRVRASGPQTMDHIVHKLKEAAAVVGYEITVDTIVCTPRGSPPQLSPFKFLMNFPARSLTGDGVWGIPCLGRLFRNLGWTQENFPDPLAQYKNVVRGFLSSHTSAWHELVSQLVLGVSHTQVPLLTQEIVDGHTNVIISEREEVSVSSIAERYHTTEEDLMLETEFFFRDLRPRLVQSSFVASVLKVDYGLDPP